MNKRKALAIGGAAALTLFMAVPAFAATTTPKTHARHGIVGTVSAINGSSLTVTAKSGTAYTVDAASAKVEKGRGKNATALTLADITTGTKVAVLGTISGTTVTAKTIFDGVTAGERTRIDRAAFGTISAINGSTVTLTHKTKTGTASVTITTTPTTTYKEKGTVATAGTLAVGQHVVVMGTKDSSGNVTAATSVHILAAKVAKTS